MKRAEPRMHDIEISSSCDQFFINEPIAGIMAKGVPLKGGHAIIFNKHGDYMWIDRNDIVEMTFTEEVLSPFLEATPAPEQSLLKVLGAKPSNITINF